MPDEDIDEQWSFQLRASPKFWSITEKGPTDMREFEEHSLFAIMLCETGKVKTFNFVSQIGPCRYENGRIRSTAFCDGFVPGICGA